MFAAMIFTAFICGFLTTRIGLPPLVGYLFAGFTLHFFGMESSDEIQHLADIGILLLLFSIGLKLKIKQLLRVEIWGSGSLHMAITSVAFGLLLFLLGSLGISKFTDFSWQQSLLLGFGLSFSSTVFAIKAFEERGDLGALHSDIAIGVLIIQDIAAVVFLTLSSGKYPSLWALALLPALFIARPLLLWTLQKSGHRELLLLFGIFVPIGIGAGGFDLVNLKPDLGALILGILLAKSPKAGELSEVILSLKDLLLVGFFLNIGLSGLPTLNTVIIALFFVLLTPLKSALFYGLFSKFKLRARTSFLSSLALSNYSEFGLLVCAIGASSGLIAKDWLVVMALALSFSFLLASPLNSKAHILYDRFCTFLKSFETTDRLPYDRPIDTGDANILIFGMGRIGTQVYDTLAEKTALKVIGLDFDQDVVAYHANKGRTVICDDATDSDLWEKICTHNIDMVMLTMASHQANMFTVAQLTRAGFEGKISATARFKDHLEELKKAGVSCAYDLYKEAGQGYAEDILDTLPEKG